VTTPQKVVPVSALVFVLLAGAYSLLPFKFAGTVDCKAPLLGAKAASASRVGFIRDPGGACKTEGKSRLTVSAFVIVLSVGLSVGVFMIPPDSKECQNGDHQDCHGRWPMAFGFSGDTGTCQCSCHG